MDARAMLDALTVAVRLKDTTRHCYTEKGRHESVAEHCWMMTLMAFFMRDEFPEADMDKVMRMCVIHDLGEAFTGDIPSFVKTAEQERDEEALLRQERAERLKAVLDSLSDRERQLFYRRYYYLQPLSQIAAETGMSERSAEGRLYRLRQRLRQELGGDEP